MKNTENNEIGAYTRDLLAQDNIVSERKVSQKPRVSGGCFIFQGWFLIS